jgi:hypothetical protein
VCPYQAGLGGHAGGQVQQPRSQTAESQVAVEPEPTPRSVAPVIYGSGTTSMRQLSTPCVVVIGHFDELPRR